MSINYTYDIGKWFATIDGEYDGTIDSTPIEKCYGEGLTKLEALENLLFNRLELID